MLEQLVLESPEAREHVEAVEAELIDAYVQGRLEPAQRARFEERFLSSPVQSEKVAFARSLAASLATVDAPRRDTAARHSLALAAALLLALGAGYVAFQAWRSPPNPAREETLRPSPRPSERIVEAPPEPPRESPAARPVHELSFVLLAGAIRGTGAIPTLVLPPAAEVVRLELQLPAGGSGTPGHQDYRAEIQTPDGATVWREAAIGAGGSGTRKAVLALRARLLATDDYVVLLSGRMPGGEWEGVADYAFRVRRQ